MLVRRGVKYKLFLINWPFEREILGSIFFLKMYQSTHFRSNDFFGIDMSSAF